MYGHFGNTQLIPIIHITRLIKIYNDLFIYLLNYLTYII
jgi:hypothetical protein